MLTVPVMMVLLFSVWTILLLVMTIGVYRWGSVFSGKAKLTDFPADKISGSDFYKRAMRAHANCVENLPVFIAIIFAVQVAGLNLTSVNYLSVIILAARVMQSIVHIAFLQTGKIILIRFFFFLIQIICFFCIACLTIAA